jgi:hypothetical protein
MVKEVAKKTRISRAEYRNLAEAFGNAKRVGKVSEYSAPAVVARVLLEAFLFEDGDVNAEWFVREKACTKGGFTRLRDRLVKDSWLYFREDSKRYFPGVRLRPYIETVRAAKAVTFADLERKADKSDLDLKADKADVYDLNERKADRSELEELRQRMARFEELARRLEAATRDPITDEKVAAQKKCAAEMKKLSRTN